MTTQPPKQCAARIRGLDCQNPRDTNSLFCKPHARACNRIILFLTTNEQLAYMMQRDGEQQ